MGKYVTVTPAYGRDYNSAKAAKADFNAGKDFILRDMMSPWDGKPVGKSDLVGKTVNIRYAKERKVTVVKA